jgi:DNA-binding NarL/FixJ family response regulator
MSGPTRLLPPTARQQECIAYLWDGLQPAEIARRVGTSPSTVKSELTEAYRRLGLGGQTAGKGTVAAVWLYAACRREEAGR